MRTANGRPYGGKQKRKPLCDVCRTKKAFAFLWSFLLLAEHPYSWFLECYAIYFAVDVGVVSCVGHYFRDCGCY